MDGPLQSLQRFLQPGARLTRGPYAVAVLLWVGAIFLSFQLVRDGAFTMDGWTNVLRLAWVHLLVLLFNRGRDAGHPAVAVAWVAYGVSTLLDPWWFGYPLGMLVEIAIFPALGALLAMMFVGSRPDVTSPRSA